MARGRGHRPHRPPGACALAAVERRPAGGRRARRGLRPVAAYARGAGPDGRLDLRHRRGASRGDRIRRRTGHDRDRWQRHDRRWVRDPRGAGRAERPRAGRLPAPRPARLPRERRRSGRLRRHQSAAGFAGSGGDLRPAEGRFAGAGRASSTRISRATPTSWPRGSGATSARRRARVRPGAWGSRCCRSRTAFDRSPCGLASTSSWS